MFGTVAVGLAVSVGGVLFEYVWAKPRFEERSPTPRVAQNSVTENPSATYTQTPVSTARRCRAFVDAKHAPVDLAPCIAMSGELLEISTKVVSRGPAEVTVHVWLWERTGKDPLEATLRTCLLTFTGPGQTEECGPHQVRPSGPGRYLAATGAQSGVADIPLVWPQGRIGILSPVALPWP